MINKSIKVLILIMILITDSTFWFVVLCILLYLEIFSCIIVLAINRLVLLEVLWKTFRELATVFIALILLFLGFYFKLLLQLILNAICLWIIIEEGTWILFHLGVKRYIMHAEFGFNIGISISIKFWCLDSHFRLTWIKTWGVGVDRCLNCGLAVYLVNHLVQSLIIIDFRNWWLKLVCIHFRLIKCWRGLVILDIKSLNDLLSLLF